MKQRYRKQIICNYSKLRPSILVKKMYWEFHKGDNDNFPSVPHGHSLNGKYKLELWSGRIYNVQTGKLEAIAKKKDMKKLQKYPEFIEFVKECRKEYVERNPSIVLPDLVIANKKRRNRRYNKAQQEKYIFETTVNKIW